MTFFGTGLTTECVSIPLNDDEILEDTETFQVVMTSQDSGVHTTAHSVADVFILDNDGVRMGIQEREYEIGESQGTLSLCVELTGRIAKNVIVHLSTESDTATGEHIYSTQPDSPPLVVSARNRLTVTACSLLRSQVVQISPVSGLSRSRSKLLKTTTKPSALISLSLMTQSWNQLRDSLSS